MKKAYITKSEMAKALSQEKGISIKDAFPRISRLKLKPYTIEVKILGQKHSLHYYRTPEKFL